MGPEKQDGRGGALEPTRKRKRHCSPPATSGVAAGEAGDCETQRDFSCFDIARWLRWELCSRWRRGLQHSARNDFLTLQLPADWGLPNFRLHPETREEFFVAEMPIHVTFSTDAKGQVTGALIYPPRGQHGIQTRRVNVGK